jgi:hypothetical protein
MDASSVVSDGMEAARPQLASQTLVQHHQGLIGQESSPVSRRSPFTSFSTARSVSTIPHGPSVNASITLIDAVLLNVSSGASLADVGWRHRQDPRRGSVRSAPVASLLLEALSMLDDEEAQDG